MAGQPSIDSSTLHKNRLSDTPSEPALLARQTLIVDHLLPHAQQRITEGCKPYIGIAAEYRRELDALVVLLGDSRYTRTNNLGRASDLVHPDSRDWPASQLAGVSFPVAYPILVKERGHNA